MIQLMIVFELGACVEYENQIDHTSRAQNLRKKIEISCTISGQKAFIYLSIYFYCTVSCFKSEIHKPQVKKRQFFQHLTLLYLLLSQRS